MTNVDIDSLLAQDEVRALLETSEHAGTIQLRELADLVEAHDLSPLEHDALLRELDKRGIEVVDPPAPLEPPPLPIGAAETTTDALQLFLREAGRHTLLTAAQEVTLAKRVERGDLQAKQVMI